jgi:anti-sigma regulatory factor (Ser/Thr protein kinase)
MTASERSIELPPELGSVRSGRHFTREVLLDWGLPQLVDDAQLGATELVSNVVRHAGTAFVLTLRLDATVTIEVRDMGAPLVRLPDPGAVDPMAESGRGLQIVSAVSLDWGITPFAAGKAVWFSLQLPNQQASDADVHQIRRARQDSGDQAGRAAI